MSPDPQPIPLNPPVDDASADGAVFDALAEVRRLQQEIRGKADELDRALDRLHQLTAAAADAAAARDDTSRVASRARNAPNEAVLHATRMAVEGNSRDAIVAELREEFGISDPDRILDEVLGTDGSRS